ncbi:unnamed protein product, partial [Closterium sp. NIES-54]
MASLRVLAFDHEGRPVHFDTWLDNLQLYLLSDIKDGVSLFDHVSSAATAPPTTADSATRSQTAHALYDAVVARYSSPATAALGRLLLPYLFPELSAFAPVEDLVSHLRASDTRYRAAVPAEFLDKNQPPMFITLYFIVTRLPDSLRSVRDHFPSLDPTSLTVDLLEQHLLAAETSAIALSAARGTPHPPFFEGCSPSPLAPSYASAAAADVPVAEDVGAASASAKRCSGKGKGVKGGGGGSGGGGGGSGSSGGGSSGGGGSGGTGGGSGGSGTGGGGTGARRVGSGGGQRQQQQQRRSETQSPQQLHLLRSRIAIFDLDFDAILSAMYALSVSAEGDCYRCVPPDLGIAAAALGASESGTLPGTVPAQALHTFTLDSGASACFFPDSTTLTPLSTPVPVRLGDPSGGPVVARSVKLICYSLVGCSELDNMGKGLCTARCTLPLPPSPDTLRFLPESTLPHLHLPESALPQPSLAIPTLLQPYLAESAFPQPYLAESALPQPYLAESALPQHALVVESVSGVMQLLQRVAPRVLQADALQQRVVHAAPPWSASPPLLAASPPLPAASPPLRPLSPPLPPLASRVVAPGGPGAAPTRPYCHPYAALLPPLRGPPSDPSRLAAEPPDSPAARAAQQPSRPSRPAARAARAAELPCSSAASTPTGELPTYWADGLSLFDLTSGVSPAPPATADSTVRSQWATRDAAARLAVRCHIPTTECAHFSQYRSAQTLYDAVVARYSSPATAALSRLFLPYLFPDLTAFPTVADLITHLRTSDTRYRAALPAEFCAKNPPPMYLTLYYVVTRLPDSLRVVRDHFLSVCPTTLTVDLLEERLLAAEQSIVA